MAVSTDTRFSPAATFLITEALRILGVINEDEIPDAGMFVTGMYTLNSLMKELEATGIHVWTEQEAILFLQQYQRIYRLGGTTSDKACDANSWIQSTLLNGAAAAATALTLTSTSGMSVGDNFGVVMNSGANFWTTIDTIANPVVNLVDALTGPVSAGAVCFTYAPANQLLRPLRVPFARRLQYANGATFSTVTAAAPDWGGIITPLTPMMARQDFMDLPQPNNPGLVTQAFYNPSREQGEMWVWNVSQTAGYALRFTAYRPIANFTSGANTGDLPDEWTNALTWILAKELAPRYSVPAERWDRVMTVASQKYEMVQGWDREPESVYFGRSSPYSRG